MIRKLPRWVEYGAFVLAALAGAVNAVGLLGFEHQAVSHLSGTATQLGTELLHPGPNALHLFGIMLSFVGGAALSGMLIDHSALKLGRHYSAALAIEGTLLLGAIAALSDMQSAGHYLASAACGLQNAMVTTYSGAIVRTTHVTGIFTDIGMLLGQRVRGKTLDRRKILLLVIIATGFILGGSVGALLFQQWQFRALAGPAAVAFALSLLYWRYANTQPGRHGTR